MCKNESIIEMFVLQEPRLPLDNYNRYMTMLNQDGVVCEPVSKIHAYHHF